MRKFSIAAAALLASTGSAIAAEDCIENAAGQLVCGADADAVRARIRAEERLQMPELSVPSAPTTNLETDQGSVEPEVLGADVVGPTLASADRSAKGRGSSSFSGGSVYNSYGQAVFVRGGYVFESGVGDYEAPSFAGGYRKTFAERGRSTFSWEGELVFSRDSEDITLLGGPVELTLWGLSGIGAVRWQYGLGAVNPFASVGIGPGYFHASLDDGVTDVSDGDLTFVYTGRAGVEFNVSDQISLETAYRFLGTSQDGTPGYHSAELGLNYNF
ncbi:MAG: porin family protein [Parvularculaceae bacterium]|nr:porin family protein [Parvularculaceae bacterium]